MTTCAKFLGSKFEKLHSFNLQGNYLHLASSVFAISLIFKLVDSASEKLFARSTLIKKSHQFRIRTTLSAIGGYSTAYFLLRKGFLPKEYLIPFFALSTIVYLYTDGFRSTKTLKRAKEKSNENLKEACVLLNTEIKEKNITIETLQSQLQKETEEVKKKTVLVEELQKQIHELEEKERISNLIKSKNDCLPTSDEKQSIPLLKKLKKMAREYPKLACDFISKLKWNNQDDLVKIAKIIAQNNPEMFFEKFNSFILQRKEIESISQNGRRFTTLAALLL